MPRMSESQTFDRAIAQLITRRAQYSKGLAEIDALFAKYGIAISGKASGPRSGSAAASPRNRALQVSANSSGGQRRTRRRRRRFAQTADEFILALVKGKDNLATADINGAWRKNGRGGTADNTLGKLVKDRRLTRTPIKDGRGSRYSLP